MLNIIGIGPGSEFERTLNKFSNQKDRLKRGVKEFLAWKNKNPANGFIPNVYPGYGNSDKKFKPKGFFGSHLPGVAHAHLTHDISIVYLVDRETSTIRVFGLYSHDDIGTGQPEDLNRQEQAAKRWASMRFDAANAVTNFDDTADKTKAAAAPKQQKFDYAPKPKVAQPTAQKERDPFFGFVKMVDEKWPDRNFFKRMQDTKTVYDRIDVINQEAQYLMRIKQRNQLYPNQMEYMRGLEGLINYLKTQQRR